MTRPVPDPSQAPLTPALKRRGMLLGAAAAAGAAVVAAKVLPGTQAEAVVAAPAKATDDAGGYRVTAHVQRYYETART
jgi:hypothetical protein